MIEIPIAAKIIPLAVAGMIALAPLPKSDVLLEMAKTTKIHKDHVITPNGFTETITIIERDSDKPAKSQGSAMDVARNIGKKMYRWIAK